jgi:hypothetical protein
VTLRETEIFRPSKAGAIVGSVHRGPCADKQRVIGANRTARPDHERGSSDPMCRAPLYTDDRGALCLNGQSVPHDRYRRIKLAARQPLRAIRSSGRSVTAQRKSLGLEAQVEGDPRMISVTLYGFAMLMSQMSWRMSSGVFGQPYKFIWQRRC